MQVDSESTVLVADAFAEEWDHIRKTPWVNTQKGQHCHYNCMCRQLELSAAKSQRLGNFLNAVRYSKVTRNVLRTCCLRELRWRFGAMLVPEVHLCPVTASRRKQFAAVF